MIKFMLLVLMFTSIFVMGDIKLIQAEIESVQTVTTTKEVDGNKTTVLKTEEIKSKH